MEPAAARDSGSLGYALKGRESFPSRPTTIIPFDDDGDFCEDAVELDDEMFEVTQGESLLSS